MSNNLFTHYSLEQTEQYLDVHCLFETVDSQIIQETLGLFSLFALVLKGDIRFHVPPIFLPIHYINQIVQLARDLRDRNRILLLVNPPESLIRYLEKNGLISMVGIN